MSLRPYGCTTRKAEGPSVWFPRGLVSLAMMERQRRRPGRLEAEHRKTKNLINTRKRLKQEDMPPQASCFFEKKWPLLLMMLSSLLVEVPCWDSCSRTLAVSCDIKIWKRLSSSP